MGKYIKLFETHDDYLDFTETEDFVLPNVSYCEDRTDEVHYNPLVVVEPLIMVYNVEDSQYAEKPIFSNNIQADAIFDKIEIDGVEIPIEYSSYDFGTVGNHTVAYTLHDPTTIPEYCFNDCSPISVTLPDTVTTIGNYAFCEDSLDSDSINAISAINPNALRSCRMY